MNLWQIGGFLSALMTWPIGFISYIPYWAAWWFTMCEMEILWVGSLFARLSLWCYQKAGFEIEEEWPDD